MSDWEAAKGTHIFPLDSRLTEQLIYRSLVDRVPIMLGDEKHFLVIIIWEIDRKDYSANQFKVSGSGFSSRCPFTNNNMWWGTFDLESHVAEMRLMVQ